VGVKDLLKNFETMDLSKLTYEQLLGHYRTINDKRSAVDKLSADMKRKEEILKSVILTRMKTEHIDSLKTKQGKLIVKESSAVITYEEQAFIKWLQGNPRYLPEVLSKKPYTQVKIKEFDDDGELPPGLRWYKESKLSITK
jgi:hypothetical protein